MQALQRLIENITVQMKALKGTARLLIAALMVIAALSLFLVAQITGQPGMLPLPMDLSNEESRAMAIAYLDSADIPYEQNGGSVLVPTEQRYTIVAKLLDSNAISPDKINFDKLIGESSPFLTRGQHEKRWLTAKMNVLSAMISSFKGIERATVVIDTAAKAGLGRSVMPASASVTVRPNGGSLSQSQVDAIAQLVAGSQSGLKVQNVAVIDARNGKAHHVLDEDEATAGKYLKQKLELEREVKETLLAAMAYIPGVIVGVNVIPDTTKKITRHDTFDNPVVAPINETSRDIDSTDQRSAGEPGVRSNIGIEIGPSNPIGSRLTDSRVTSKMEPRFPQKSTYEEDSKGYPLKINATVSVPRSYFIAKYQQDQGDPEAEPDAATLATIEQSELDRIKLAIEPLIDTGPLENTVVGQIVVSSYPDFAMLVDMAPVNLELEGGSWFGGGGSGAGGIMTDGLVRYVGLGGLAFISLAMMFLMVRKATVREALPSAEEIAGLPPMLETPETDLIGEAEESALALEGLELDDAELRRQQVTEQINETIKNDPSESANLVRRWAKGDH